MNNLFYGAWILPNGNIHYTNNIQSHAKVIDELNIRHILEKNALKIKWSKYEIDNYFNFDLAYIAMKIGYVRITNFNLQIGIQYGKIPFSKNTITSIETVCQHIIHKHYIEDNNFNYFDITYTIEEFESKNKAAFQCNTLYELIKYCNQLNITNQDNY